MASLSVPPSSVDRMLREMASCRGGVWRPKLADDAGLGREHGGLVEECVEEWGGRREQLKQYVTEYRGQRERMGGAEFMNLE